MLTFSDKLIIDLNFKQGSKSRMIKNFLKSTVLVGVVFCTLAYAEPTAVWVDSYIPANNPLEKQALLLKNGTFNYKKERPIIRLAPLIESQEALQTRAHKTQSSNTLGTPLNAGVNRFIESIATIEKFNSYLDWETLADGSHLAALSIISPQATGSRFIFNIEQLHPKAELRFSSESNDEVFIVSGEEIINTTFKNNQENTNINIKHNLYIAPYLSGEQANVEIFLPKEISLTDIKIAIPNLSHIFLAPDELELFQQRNSDQSCMVNAECDASWDDVSNSVAKMLYTDAAGDSFICTGTLINDTQNSKTPYFLTANHCINSQQEASTLQTFWFYKTMSCQSNIVGNYTRLSKGADLLFNQAETDTALLRLREMAPAGAIFQGWTTATAKNSYIGVIHHPNGKPQKLSTGFTELEYADCKNSGIDSFVCQSASSSDAGYLPVKYNNSATAPGSSGSGLFITKGILGSQYLVGQLYGGGSSCEIPGKYDFYGRFDLAYTAGLSTWLAAKKTDEISNDKRAIYRFYNTKSGTHFFTGSIVERNNVINKYPSFTYEGSAFYAYPKIANTLSPVYRFYHKVLGSHFYTISKNEKEKIEQKYPNYIYEGVAWYAAENTTLGSKPLYRFYNTKTGTHFYTVNTTEKNNIINKYASYIYEGIAYYVWVK